LDRKPATPLLFGACCLAACALLAACGPGDRAASAAQAGGEAEAPLPKPEAGSGSITGMPDRPGPGPVGGSVADTGVDTGTDADADAGIPPGDAVVVPPDDGTLPEPPADETQPAPPMPAEPTPADAAAVVDAYYAAIAANQYPRAYALWSGGGQASGQTAQQFAGGFADTASVSVDVGTPGRVDAAAGSRYVEIPVTVTATRRDGSVHRYAGAYTLRRAVVDGATAEQRAWRIASADLREVQP
jgi:hypothetical protein